MFKNLMYLAILTTATVASWIGFSIYHNYSTSTIDDAVKIRITPIPGEFDREVIESIKSKKTIPADLSDTREIISITTAPTLSQQASPGAQVEL